MEMGFDTIEINLVLCYFRGLRCLDNTTVFPNRQVHIHTDLKGSSQPKSGHEMPQLAPEWPVHPLRDQLGLLGAPEVLSGYFRATQGPVGASQGPSEAVRTNLCQ